MRITSILGTEEIFHLTMEKWEVIMEEESVTGGHSNEWEDMDLLGETIEILFDMLPPIRSVRRRHVLRIEAFEKAGFETDGKTITPTSGFLRTDFRAVIDRNLRQIETLEEAIKQQEEFSHAQGQEIQPLTSRIAKTRLQLGEWKKNDANEEIIANKWESQEVRKMQHQLSNQLGIETSYNFPGTIPLFLELIHD